MAETAWRCSQCGTVNEPGSHACAGCGKWPSLFDLQDEIEEPEAFEPAPLDPAKFGDDPARPEPVDLETFDPEPVESEQFEPASESDDEPKPARGLRSLTRVIVPVAVLLYFIISQLSNR
jgi:hypothetical protein